LGRQVAKIQLELNNLKKPLSDTDLSELRNRTSQLQDNIITRRKYNEALSSLDKWLGKPGELGKQETSLSKELGSLEEQLRQHRSDRTNLATLRQLREEIVQNGCMTEENPECSKCGLKLSQDAVSLLTPEKLDEMKARETELITLIDKLQAQADKEAAKLGSIRSEKEQAQAEVDVGKVS
jgi:uncharacterized small protein (DUF1192 family)